MTVTVPFNRPAVVGEELRYLEECLLGGHWSGDGRFTRRCHEILETSVGVRKALLTTSCTHALEMAALLLDIMPGDEIIVPSFTFVSTINAFVLRGAQPVFVDIREDTLNVDERQLESLVTARTRAIIPVHYAGVACDMPAILTTASRHGLAVVEDNAHGLYGKLRGRQLGTFGAMATQSFHETKNFTCGEGGALLINDEALIERAEIVREKGTNRSKFFRGQIDKYGWVDLGSSYLPSELLAAMLCAQLEARASIQKRRNEIWNRYDSGLRSWATQNGVRTPTVPAECEQSFHMYYLIFPSLEARQRMMLELKGRGIGSAFHYLPLHASAMGLKHGGVRGQCPVSEKVSDRLLRLPFYVSMTDGEQEKVIQSVEAIGLKP